MGVFTDIPGTVAIVEIQTVPGIMDARPPSIDIDIVKSDIHRSAPVVILPQIGHLHLKVQMRSGALPGVVHNRDKLALFHGGAAFLQIFGDAVLFQVQIEMIGVRFCAFIFDNQILTQAFYFGYRIGEISSPCSYNCDCSSISFKRSIRYGLRVLHNTLRFLLQKSKIRRYRMFDEESGRKLAV